MGRKAKKTPPPLAGDPSDALGFAVLLAEYLLALRSRNYSEATVKGRTYYLNFFAHWCGERALTRPCEVTKPLLERYQRYLYAYRGRGDRPLSFRSQAAHLVPVRAMFKWLCRQNYLLSNPASDLDLPRVEHRLPKHVLSASEVEQVLAQANTSDPLGLRDRAMMEVFYSTGMRRLPPHLRDAHARGRSRHPFHPAAARSRQRQHDTGLHPSFDPPIARGACQDAPREGCYCPVGSRACREE